jgi:hypothetical protein
MLADEVFVQKLKELLGEIGLVVDKFIVLNILIDGRYHIATYFSDLLTQEVTVYTDIDRNEVFSNAIVVVGTGAHFELLEDVHFVDDEEEIEEKQEEMEQDELMARQLSFQFEQEELARRLQEEQEEQERKDEELARRLQEEQEEQERKDEELARRLQEEQEEQKRTHTTEEERRMALTRSVVPTGLRLNQDVLNYNPPPPRRQRTYLTERERYELLSRLFDG